MFKRNCAVKFVDNFEVEHAAKVEAESFFEAAVRGLHRLASSFWAEENLWDRMFITVEVHEEPTTHTVMVAKRRQGSPPPLVCDTTDETQEKPLDDSSFL
jgi:hypothetical protein